MPPGLGCTLFCGSLSCLVLTSWWLSPCTSYSELLNSSLAGFINALPAPIPFPTFPLSHTVQSYDCSFFVLDGSASCRWHPSWPSLVFPLPFCSLYPSSVPVLYPIPFPPFLSVTCSYWSLFADWWFLIGSGPFFLLSAWVRSALAAGVRSCPVLILSVRASLFTLSLLSEIDCVFFLSFICVCVFLTACPQSHHCCIPFFLFKCEMFVLFGGSD